MASSKKVIALIQGANRGIGFEFCKHIAAKHPGAMIIATCRNPENADKLKELKNMQEDPNRYFSQLYRFLL